MAVRTLFPWVAKFKNKGAVKLTAQRPFAPVGLSCSLVCFQLWRPLAPSMGRVGYSSQLLRVQPPQQAREQ